MHRTNVNAEGKTNMSSKLLAPILAAPLALAAIAPDPVLARKAANHLRAYRHYQKHYGQAHSHQPYSQGPYGQAPARDAGSFPFFEPPPGRPLQTDPDPNVRFELNRDSMRGRS
jgi:hypothetical protein